MLHSLLLCPSTWFVYPPPRGQRHSCCVRAYAQTTATAAPDCNTSSSSSVASRRWSRVLAPQGINPAFAVAVGMMVHTQQQQHGRYHSVRKIMQFLLIILKLNFLYIKYSGEIGRRCSAVFGFFKPCWYSYSYHNNQYIFRQGDMTCLRSSKRSPKPSKTRYPVGKHLNNLMPYKIIPRYGLRAISGTTPIAGEHFCSDVFEMYYV